MDNTYQLIDATCGERLERWGEVILIRPDPQILWKAPRRSRLWDTAHARYVRSSQGGGAWEFYRALPDEWAVAFDDLTFLVRPTGFKHTGVFPEQQHNWRLLRGIAAQADTPVRALNLFGYTGCLTTALLKEGASLCHVDASKGIVAWAKDNAAKNGVADRPVRWIVDDCVKFVEREQRRNSRYDIVVMDPPSYGRGPGGEVWKLEDEIYGLIERVTRVLSDEPRAVLVNSYTAGIAPSVMAYMLRELMPARCGGQVTSYELTLPVEETGGQLPCGGSALWTR